MTLIIILFYRYIKPGALILVTKTLHICLSSSSVTDRDEWIAALNDAAAAARQDYIAIPCEDAKFEAVSLNCNAFIPDSYCYNSSPLL